jgi:hypothetical protein
MNPLSVGNVIGAGLRIYRDNFKKYFQLAFLGYLWIFLPVVILGIAGAIAEAILGQLTSGIYVLLTIAAIVFLIYGCGKYYAITGLISRLSYQEVIEQPETVKDAKRQIKPQMWNFLIAGVTVGLILFGALVVYLIVVGALGGIISLIFARDSPIAPIIGVAFTVLAVLLLILGFIWLFSRLFLIELPLGVENTNVIDAISRSWELTKSSISIQLVVFAAFLISIPLVLVVNIISFMLQIAIGAAVENNPGLAGIALILYMAIAFAGGALIVPFWQTIKAVIYYDLRVRHDNTSIDLAK